MKIDEQYIKVYEKLAVIIDYDILQYCYDYQLATTPAEIFGRAPPARKKLPPDIIDICARRAVYAAYLLSRRSGAMRCDIATRYQRVIPKGDDCLRTTDDGGADVILRLRETLWDILPEQRCQIGPI